jgi:hypothetical protein
MCPEASKETSVPTRKSESGNQIGGTRHFARVTSSAISAAAIRISKTRMETNVVIAAAPTR